VCVPLDLPGRESESRAPSLFGTSSTVRRTSGHWRSRTPVRCCEMAAPQLSRRLSGPQIRCNRADLEAFLQDGCAVRVELPEGESLWFHPVFDARRQDLVSLLHSSTVPDARWSCANVGEVKRLSGFRVARSLGLRRIRRIPFWWTRLPQGPRYGVHPYSSTVASVGTTSLDLTLPPIPPPQLPPRPAR